MGCGQSQLKSKLESEITANKELKVKLQTVQLTNAAKRQELSAEIKRASKEIEASTKAAEIHRARSTSEFEIAFSEWSAENSELSKSLIETTQVATVATSDAQRMRVLAMQMDDVANENRRLVREKLAVQTELEKARDELKLARLVFEGQKQVLELEREEEAEKGQKAVQQASTQFQAIESQLVSSVREVEDRLCEAEDRERLQREANIQLLRQGVPHGSVAIPVV